MNLDNIRTFLEVAATGNFHRAAESLNVTQSTVSARIKTLEDHFGLALFRRLRSGVELTGAGQRFRRYALNLQHSWRQAYQSVTLPEGYRDVIALSAQVSLWYRLILPWIPWMRRALPDVALRVDADYSTSQMRQLADGLLDIGVMYQPRQMPGLQIETLFEETLVLVGTEARKATQTWLKDYVFIDWGDVFRDAHAEAFPEMETPALSIGYGELGLHYILENGGSGYFPLRVVGPLIDEGKLHRLEDGPVVHRPVYLVYARDPINPDLLDQALTGLRKVAEPRQGER